MNFDFNACSHCNGKKESYESADVYRQESSLAAAVLAGVVVLLMNSPFEQLHSVIPLRE